jgi:phage antirepressor YoqD-like protein
MARAVQFSAKTLEAYRQKLTALESENAAMKPGADYYNRLVSAKGLTNFRDTAKELGIPEKDFIALLIQRKYVFRDRNGDLRPYAERTEYFSLKDWENGGHSGVQARITVAGKAHFMKIFGKREEELFPKHI